MSSSSSSRDRKKEKKIREAEKFDNNVDLDMVNPGTSSSSSQSHSPEKGKSVSSAKSPNNGGMSDSGLAQFCDAIKEGFASVTLDISKKLDAVGDKMSKSVVDANLSMQEKLKDLPGPSPFFSDSEGEFDFESNRGDGSQDGGSYFGGSERSSQCDSQKGSDKAAKGSYFKSLNKTPRDERLGEKVDNDLAEATDRFFRKPISQEEFKELKEKYVRPENIQWIRAPEIPFNIYRRLPSEFKGTDKALLYVQEQLCPVAVSLTYAMEKLGEGDLEGGRDLLSDTMSALGHVFRVNLTDKRRSLLKAKLPEDFKVLVSDKCEPTATNLLGDMSENAKKVAETEKLATQMDRSSKAKTQSQNQKKGAFRNKGPYKGNFNKGGAYGKKYDDQKRNYDRRDDRSNRDNRDNRDNRSFYKGGQNKK